MSVTHHVGVGVLVPLTLHPDLGLDGLTDGQLTGPLTDLCQIGSTEAVCHLGQVVHVYIL